MTESVTPTIPSPRERLEQLVGVGALLTTELSLEGVLQRVVEVAARLIGAKYAAIGVLGPDGRMLESFTTYGLSEAERAAIGPPPRGHGILGLVIREAQVIRIMRGAAYVEDADVQAAILEPRARRLAVMVDAVPPPDVTQDDVDEASWESFPASDPPGGRDRR